jgi:hypothetical protein
MPRADLSDAALAYVSALRVVVRASTAELNAFAHIPELGNVVDEALYGLLQTISSLALKLVLQISTVTAKDILANIEMARDDARNFVRDQEKELTTAGYEIPVEYVRVTRGLKLLKIHVREAQLQLAHLEAIQKLPGLPPTTSRAPTLVVAQTRQVPTGALDDLAVMYLAQSQAPDDSPLHIALQNATWNASEGIRTGHRLRQEIARKHDTRILVVGDIDQQLETDIVNERRETVIMAAVLDLNEADIVTTIDIYDETSYSDHARMGPTRKSILVGDNATDFDTMTRSNTDGFMVTFTPTTFAGDDVFHNHIGLTASLASGQSFSADVVVRGMAGLSKDVQESHIRQPRFGRGFTNGRTGDDTHFAPSWIKDSPESMTRNWRHVSGTKRVAVPTNAALRPLVVVDQWNREWYAGVVDEHGQPRDPMIPRTHIVTKRVNPHASTVALDQYQLMSLAAANFHGPETQQDQYEAIVQIKETIPRSIFTVIPRPIVTRTRPIRTTDHAVIEELMAVPARGMQPYDAHLRLALYSAFGAKNAPNSTTFKGTRLSLLRFRSTVFEPARHIAEIIASCTCEYSEQTRSKWETLLRMAPPIHFDPAPSHRKGAHRAIRWTGSNPYDIPQRLVRRETDGVAHFSLELQEETVRTDRTAELTLVSVEPHHQFHWAVRGVAGQMLSALIAYDGQNQQTIIHVQRLFTRLRHLEAFRQQSFEDVKRTVWVIRRELEDNLMVGNTHVFAMGQSRNRVALIKPHLSDFIGRLWFAIKSARRRLRLGHALTAEELGMLNNAAKLSASIVQILGRAELLRVAKHLTTRTALLVELFTVSPTLAPETLAAERIRFAQISGALSSHVIADRATMQTLRRVRTAAWKIWKQAQFTDAPVASAAQTIAVNASTVLEGDVDIYDTGLLLQRARLMFEGQASYEAPPTTTRATRHSRLFQAADAAETWTVSAGALPPAIDADVHEAPLDIATHPIGVDAIAQAEFDNALETAARITAENIETETRRRAVPVAPKHTTRKQLSRAVERRTETNRWTTKHAPGLWFGGAGTADLKKRLLAELEILRTVFGTPNFYNGTTVAELEEFLKTPDTLVAVPFDRVRLAVVCTEGSDGKFVVAGQLDSHTAD